MRKLTGKIIIISFVTMMISGSIARLTYKYIIGNSLIRDINHKGRLKRAFKKLGKNGLILYCKQYMKNDSSELEQAINAAF